MDHPSKAPIDPALVDGLLDQAIAEFAAGDYFTCHETLERLWLGNALGIAPCWKGIIQLAAAMVHAQRANPRGCRRLLESGLALVAPYGDTAGGVDLALLRRSAEATLAAVLASPVEGFGPAVLATPPRLQRA